MHFNLFILLAAQASAMALRDQPVLNPNSLIIAEPISDTHLKRGVCHRDHLLQKMKTRKHKHSAHKFCSKFIQSTVTHTVYQVATTRVITTAPRKVVTVADVDVVSRTTTTGTITVTQTATLPDTQQNKRGHSWTYPNWLGDSYSPRRVSSACSCLIPKPSAAVHRTVTKTISTQTIFKAKYLPTGTTTITRTSIHMVPVAATQTETVLPPTCGKVGCSNADYVIESSQDYTTLADCKAHCLKFSDCHGFQFSPQGCSIAKVNAATLYSSYSYLFPPCELSKLYDSSCDV